jgi:hypothetical protein
MYGGKERIQSETSERDPTEQRTVFFLNRLPEGSPLMKKRITQNKDMVLDEY